MGIISTTIGIDLGTCNTQLTVKKKGLILDEPTILVTDKNGKSFSRAAKNARAIGNEARIRLGRTAGDVIAVRPLQDGTIRDHEMTRQLLAYFVRKAIGTSRLIRPTMLITVPCRISPVEREAVKQAAIFAGAGKNHIHFIEKPFATALGCGLPIKEPQGSMIVDVGGGTTEVAVLSLGGIVISRSIRIGGMRMDEAIISYVKREFNMLIGDRTAEEVKIDLGAALPLKEERRVTVRGRDLVTNLPQTADLSSSAVYEALKAPCEAILAAIRYVLEKTPPELAGDILRSGIHLAGGGAMLFGLDHYIAQELDIPVRLAKDPMLSAAQGIVWLTEHIETLSQLSTGTAINTRTEEKDS